MPLAALETLKQKPLALLLGGAAALFVASRLLAVFIPRSLTSLGARAFAFFIPIALVALTASLLGRPEMAISVVFGTSVGAMTTAIGFIAVASPIGGGPSRWRRLWPFLLAPALLVLVAGFDGTLHWRHATALLTEGLVLLALWREQPESPGVATAISVEPDLSSIPPLARILTAIAAILLAAAAAWAVTHGSIAPTLGGRRLSTGATGATIISLSMVMPMMYGTWRMASAGRSWAPVTAQVGVVFLNLCLLLPLLILMPYVAQWAPEIAKYAGESMIADGRMQNLFMPPAVWRIDNVILIVVGILLIPVAIGKWTLSREEGLFLIAAYFFYLTATLAIG
jgi:cation:H+ antiporter